MNEQLYQKLGIDSSQDINDILSELQDKQFEYLQRSETAGDENRKKEIADVLQQIDDEISVLEEHIKTLSSSVVIDDSTDNAPVKKEDKEKKGAEVARKVDALKQREAEKKAKEAEKMQQEAEKAAMEQQAQQAQSSNVDTVQQNASQGFSQMIIDQLSDPVPDITIAIYYCNNGEYDKCFQVLKNLSEDGNSSAQFLIATMYQFGIGMEPDESRAMYWLKRSAYAGEIQGQAVYGSMIISKPFNDPNDIKEGFKYMQLAADKGNLLAMRYYVNACMDYKGDKKNIAKAMEYCDKLKLNTADSFDKEQYEEKKKWLKERKKTAGNNNNNIPAPANTPISFDSYQPKKEFPWKKIIIIAIIAFIGFNVWKTVKGSLKYIEEIGNEKTEATVNNKTFGKTAEKEETAGKVKITVASGNVRSGAGKSNDSVGVVHDGEEYEMTGNQETVDGTVWYEIYFDDNNQTGWVSSKILEVQ